jgi:TPR repeat protein
MPIFSGMHALIAAAIIAVALTGLFTAQTSMGGSSEARTGPGAVAAPAKTAHDLFVDGNLAFEDGRLVDALADWGQAADAGYLLAQWNLARVLADADGGAHDPVRSLKYLRMAAAQHDADLPYGPRSAVTVEALVELALIYRDGLPEAKLAPAPGRAVSLLEHTATLYGNPRAQHALGLMYLGGQGVKRDTGRAVRWLVLAARKDHAPAQAALGDFYWKSEPSAGNRARGLMWFALARDNAHGDLARAAFAQRYDAAAAEAGAETRKAADDMISSWNASQAVAAN